MTPKQRCQQIAARLGVTVRFERVGREIQVEAVTPDGAQFAVNGSHTLVSREYAGFRGGAARLWDDMADRLTHEELTDCHPDCNCHDG